MSDSKSIARTIACAVPAAWLLVLSGQALAAEKMYLENGTGNPTNNYGECWNTIGGMPSAKCSGEKMMAAPADSDGDGVTDDKDQCPGTPKGVKVNAVGCPIDSDGDGVPDHKDRCPNTPKGAKVDEYGCLIQLSLDNVYFDFNKATLRPESMAVLDKVVKALGSGPAVKQLRVIGHTDSIGSDAYNKRLSERRAAAVMDYLGKQGVSRSTMSAEGQGESQPVADNRSKEGRAKNRRVEFKADR